jgi:hypothetical protein
VSTDTGTGAGSGLINAERIGGAGPVTAAFGGCGSTDRRDATVEAADDCGCICGGARGCGGGAGGDGDEAR